MRSSTLRLDRKRVFDSLSVMNTPGSRLREARKRLGMSANDLAVHVGRSASAVRNQENGTNGIPSDLAAQYAAVLGVEPQWLLYGDGSGMSDATAPRPPVTLTQLANGKARLEVSVTLPLGAALKILAVVEEAQK